MDKRLTALDLIFLMVDTNDNPAHFAALQIFRAPPAARKTEEATKKFVTDLIGLLSQDGPLRPPFNRKLAPALTRLAPEKLVEKVLGGTQIPGLAHWVEQEELDFGRHLDQLTIEGVTPASADQGPDMDALLDLVEKLHQPVLTRDVPLWQMTLIDGLGDGYFAVYCKVHHALVDGISGMRIMSAAYDSSQRKKLKGGPWHKLPDSDRDGERRRSPRLFDQMQKALSGLMGEAKTLPQLGKIMFDQGLQGAGLKDNTAPAPFTAPKTRFNRSMDGRRKFAVTSHSLANYKAVAKALDATLNDIVLAVSGGALRAWMQHHEDLPKDSLVAAVPVALKVPESDGNAFSVLQTTLATDEGDPVARVRRIQESVAVGKAQIEASSPTTGMALAMIGNAITVTLNRLRLTNLMPPATNIVISNVPGPKETLYLNGAELMSSYPLSMLQDGIGTNFTVASYKDRLDFGVISATKLIPDGRDMARYIDEAFAELEAKALK